MEAFLSSGMHWKLINFFLFVAGLIYLLRKPLKEFWLTRSETIRTDLDESTRLAREARAKYDQLEKRLSQINAEAETLIRSIDQEGELERQQMIREAEGLQKRFKSDSERIAEQEIRKAQEALKKQTARLSLELAERLIREKMNEEDQSRITQSYVSELERGAV